MPNIDDSSKNQPIQPKSIGKKPQKPQETAEVQNPPKDIAPQTDLRNDPLAVIGRSKIDVKHPLDPKTQANIAKDVQALNEFLEQNREFADLLIDIRNEVRSKHPDWSQEQVIDFTIKIGQELEKHLKSA